MLLNNRQWFLKRISPSPPIAVVFFNGVISHYLPNIAIPGHCINANQMKQECLGIRFLRQNTESESDGNLSISQRDSASCANRSPFSNIVWMVLSNSSSSV